MKKILLTAGLLASLTGTAQTAAEDEGNRRQLERMASLHWDNWEPWGIYWSLFHSDYKKDDKRLLAGTAPYLAHLGALEIQRDRDEKYKMYTDSIAQRHEAIASNWMPGIPDVPWWVHYKKVFEDLEDDYASLVNSQPGKVQTFMQDNSLLTWYGTESDLLKDRLETVKGAFMARGSRVMAYQRLQNEYRQLNERFRAMVVVARNYVRHPVFKPGDPHDQEGPYLRAVHSSIDEIKAREILSDHFKRE